MYQKTLKNPFTFHGVGLHSGQVMTVRLLPADPHTGIIFVRTDVTEHNEIPARWDYVSMTRFCTQLSNPQEVCIGTVEHLMAALAACEVDNVYVLVNGPEVPIMDGSAAPFIKLIEEAGLLSQGAPRSILKILKPIRIKEDSRYVSVTPADTFSISFDLDFKGRQGLGVQSYTFQGTMQEFRDDMAGARTYGFLEDAETLQRAGLAKGASLDNAVVWEEGRVLNQEGLRYEDECVRHKILDVVGDLYLAGAPLQGHIDARNSGHEFNNALLHRIFKEADSYIFTSSDSKNSDPKSFYPSRLKPNKHKTHPKFPFSDKTEPYPHLSVS